MNIILLLKLHPGLNSSVMVVTHALDDLPGLLVSAHLLKELCRSDAEELADGREASHCGSVVPVLDGVLLTKELT